MSRPSDSTSLLKRLPPVLTLGLLAPLVAEYLLGDFRITNLAPLPFLICTYGCGAVLIREMAMRKGWSLKIYLALTIAYALFEEGIVNQSIFNPEYMHLHLLAYGFWPLLGTSPFWIISVTTTHVVWSIGVPMGMTESLFPARSSQPWLGWPGLTVAAVLFVLGDGAVGRYSYQHASHHASSAQIAICSVLILALLAFAFLSRRSRPVSGSQSTRVAPFLLGLFCFFTGSLLVAAYGVGAFILHLPGTVTAVAVLALDLLVLIVFRNVWSRHWTALELCSASTAGLLVYTWHGYLVDHALHGTGGLPGHSMIVLGLCAVQAVAWIRVVHFDHNDAAGTVANETWNDSTP